MILTWPSVSPTAGLLHDHAAVSDGIRPKERGAVREGLVTIVSSCLPSVTPGPTVCTVTALVTTTTLPAAAECPWPQRCPEDRQVGQVGQVAGEAGKQPGPAYAPVMPPKPHDAAEPDGNLPRPEHPGRPGGVLRDHRQPAEGPGNGHRRSEHHAAEAGATGAQQQRAQRCGTESSRRRRARVQVGQGCHRATRGVGR